MKRANGFHWVTLRSKSTARTLGETNERADYCASPGEGETEGEVLHVASQSGSGSGSAVAGRAGRAADPFGGPVMLASVRAVAAMSFSSDPFGLSFRSSVSIRAAIKPIVSPNRDKRSCKGVMDSSLARAAKCSAFRLARAAFARAFISRAFSLVKAGARTA